MKSKCFSLYYPVYLYIFTVLKNFRAKIEPLAKYPFSPYPTILHVLPRQLSSLIWHFTCFTLFYLFHLVLLILPYFTCSRLGASLDYIPVTFMLSLKIKRIAQKVSVLDACPKEIGMVSIVVLALKALTKRWLHTLVHPYAKLTTKNTICKNRIPKLPVGLIV